VLRKYFYTVIISVKKLNALVSLLEDPDEKIFCVIKSLIKAERIRVLPILEKIIADNRQDLQHHRAEEICKELRCEELYKSLDAWKKSDDKDLLNGIITLNRFHNVHLDDAKVSEKIAEIRRAIWLELNDNQTSFEQVKIFNHVFYEVLGFQVTQETVPFIESLDIEKVLESKIGHPLTVGILYSILANQLDLPIYGVDFPYVFVLAWMDDNHLGMLSELENDYGVLFYINPTNNGVLFDGQHMTDFLSEMDIKPQRGFFEPSSNTRILRRYISTYETFCKMNGETETLESMIQLREIL
jgi:hypothetical protein